MKKLLLLMMALLAVQGANAQCPITRSPMKLIYKNNDGALYYSLEFSSCKDGSPCAVNRGLFGFIQHTFPSDALIWLFVKGYDCTGKAGLAELNPGGNIPPNTTIECGKGGFGHMLRSASGLKQLSISYHKGKDLIEIYVDMDKDINYYHINGKTVAEYNAERVQRLAQQQEEQQEQQNGAYSSNTNNPAPGTNNPAPGTNNAYTNNSDAQIYNNRPVNFGTPQVSNVTNSTTQQQQYQQQANNYLDAANNAANDPLQQSLYQSLAEINATAAGNNAQAQQIQQQISQQQLVNAQDIPGKTAELATGITSLIADISEDKRNKKENLKKYEYVGDAHKRLRRVSENGKWGYMLNYDGSLVIPLQFDSVGNFTGAAIETASAKLYARVKQNGKWGFIKTTFNKVCVGSYEIITPFKYDYAEDFHKGRAKVWLNGKMLFINKKGEEIN